MNDAIKFVREESPVCVKCHKDDLQIGNLTDSDGKTGYADYKCNACGYEGQLEYRLVFVKAD
jgi:tRNA(Ile2) C34 agmatinyltransferase TiaS